MWSMIQFVTKPRNPRLLVGDVEAFIMPLSGEGEGRYAEVLTEPRPVSRKDSNQVVKGNISVQN